MASRREEVGNAALSRRKGGVMQEQLEARHENGRPFFFNVESDCEFGETSARYKTRGRNPVAAFELKALMLVLSRSHKGAAGMRSVLTFEKVVWIVDARVER
jgi:hypothetical protein